MKQKLLLLSIVLFIVQTSFSQTTPINDLIENAIEITGANFTDQNVRLDLATTTGENPTGCGTGSFTKVFYKYTATADANLTGIISDVISSPITQSFIIVYTAPDLNQTDLTQLALVSDCAFGESASTAVSSGQSYYIEVHRSDVDALSNITFSIATPPANDTIENAIEITGSEYFVEATLRLDLAAANPGGQSGGGCPLVGLSTVYYKFTANTNGSAFFRISGSETSYVVAYSAPSLNALNSDLNLVSSCTPATQTTFNIVEGQVYYVLVNRDAPGALSAIDARIDQDGTPEERQVLIDLYNAANGPNWPLGANVTWNNPAPLSTWTNVRVDNGHVVSVVLGTFGITGTLPASLADLTFLEIADFRSCNLSGEVPDLSSITTLEKFDISNNKFSFGGLETHFTNNSTIPDFRYNPQKTLDAEITFEPVLGTNYTLSLTPDTGSNISYQWYKQRGTVDQNIIIPGATSSSYDILNIQSDDLDAYTCEITSSIIPDLTIYRSTINLTGPVSQQEKDALIAFYNALDGPNWTDNTNWLSTEPVSTWSFIKTRGNKVIGIESFNNNVGFNGQLPIEIGDLVDLEELDIALEAGLTGPLPTSIGNLTKLQQLRLQGTSNSGEIPASIGNLSELRELRLLGTNFSGPLPSTMGNLTELRDMTIPGDVFLGNANNFTGQIPSTLGNLINLTNMNLNRNSFDGQIPSSFSNLINLISLSLFENNLSGLIPDLTGFANPESVFITLSNNYFDFGDLEPLINNGISYGQLNYSPQRTLDQEEDISTLPGVDITLDINDTGITRLNTNRALNNVYQWFKDSNPISGANSTTYTIVNAQESDSGVYYCEITNPTVPDLVIVRANINLLVDSNLSIEDIENNTFSIYPNPTANWLNIAGNSLINSKAEVYDLNGRLVISKKIKSNITILNVETLSPGVYVMKMTNEQNATTTKRFIKL
jgi:hypothetical protein